MVNTVLKPVDTNFDETREWMLPYQYMSRAALSQEKAGELGHPYINLSGIARDRKEAAPP